MKKDSVQKTVASIIAQIRKQGDQALISMAKKYDKVKLTPKTLRVSDKKISTARKRLSEDKRKAIETCARRIQEFHWNERKHMPQSWTMNQSGVTMGQIFSPIESVGIYVPGGRFSYPSTVLMTTIPARLAGVERRVVVTPPGRLTDEILFAAEIAGVTDLYQVGGPAAVAALGVGTKTISKVDLIIGPGNALVTEAKRQLFGEVGIDLLAGPSELVVLADETANADWIAADLGAQAEHDPDATGYLITTSSSVANAVKRKIKPSVKKQCKIFVVANLKKAIDLANQIAGEHVQIMVKRPQECLDTLKNGGAFFIDSWSPAVMGDYWAGPSHVLPTGQSGRFGSGLSVMTFLKRSSLINISSRAFQKGWGAAYKMAQMEGLNNHAEALKVRMEGEDNE